MHQRPLLVLPAPNMEPYLTPFLLCPPSARRQQYPIVWWGERSGRIHLRGRSLKFCLVQTMDMFRRSEMTLCNRGLLPFGPTLGPSLHSCLRLQKCRAPENGFIGIYEETIFLRQFMPPSGTRGNSDLLDRRRTKSSCPRRQKPGKRMCFLKTNMRR